MGLDAASIGSASIARAIQARRLVRGDPDESVYFSRVRTDASEMQALVESLVVNETWFFREREALAALAKIAGDRCLATPGAAPLRVLSLPCSTGEEPYSMVMALLDAGLAAQEFSIDGVDISANALAIARKGCFGSNSFRGSELSYRGRYFTEQKGAYLLSESVRSAVTLQQGNLFSASFLPGAGIYDVIFCRNVLIYFDDTMKDRAVAVLTRLLAPSGFVFVGSAERAQMSHRGWKALRVAGCHAFQKSAPAHLRPMPTTPARQTQRAAVQARRPAPLPQPQAAAKAAPPKAPVSALASDPLARVSMLADQGQLEPARLLCEQTMNEHGTSAAAFCLMGLIRGASGDVKGAMDAYRKALFLDAQHMEALIHLATLQEQQGDLPGANLLRARFERARAKGGQK